jgi:hypothetical protein
MTRTKQIETIRQAFSAIPDLQDGWTDVKDRLQSLNAASERRHRQGTTRNGLSVQLAAAYFTVSHLLDSMAAPDRYTVDDILCIRTEVLYSQAYAKKFRKELEPWAAEYRDRFVDVNYSELMARS